MAGFRCKKCNTHNLVLNKWIELGVSRVVTCRSCGHKMNLNLAAKKKPAPQIEEISHPVDHVINKGDANVINNKGDTNIVGLNKSSINNYSFQIISGSQINTEFKVHEYDTSHTIFIGRNPKSLSDNSKDFLWAIDDPFISRTHCVINVMISNEKIQFILEDNNSSNGTVVNENKLESGDRILLNIFDEINIGDTVFRVKQE